MNNMNNNINNHNKNTIILSLYEEDQNLKVYYDLSVDPII